MDGLKENLLTKVVTALVAEHAALAKALDDSSAAATDPGSKAEGKYDTRSLEMSYLAAGQAKQAQALEGGLEKLQRFEVTAFEITDAVALGALVEVEKDGDWSWYFLLPDGGGIEVEDDGRLITSLTPESPLFTDLEGKRIGEQTQAGALVSEVC